MASVKLQTVRKEQKCYRFNNLILKRTSLNCSLQNIYRDLMSSISNYSYFLYFIIGFSEKLPVDVCLINVNEIYCFQLVTRILENLFGI